MCRLFGFRSVVLSQVHRSLMGTDNALGMQSQNHPDGWGVAYYIDGAPHITKSPSTALSDKLFHRVSGIVSSETVLAHVRKATTGENSVLNCHPFQHGRWVFAHNGEVPEFARVKAELTNEIAPRLRRFVLGETDSEILFFMFLSELARHGPLAKDFAIDDVHEALRNTIARVREVCDSESENRKSLLTMVTTNGNTLAAVHGGKELFWSTYKTSCADRDVCPSFATECEAETQTGFVNHLIVTSEPLGGENVWIEMNEDQMVGVDWRMKLLQPS